MEIEKLIHTLRGHKVMLDSVLANLYGVNTKHFNESVQRNLERFPPDFMFQLTSEEFKNLMAKIGISSSTHGGTRKLPYVFTENGVAMLTSVLRSSASNPGQYLHYANFYAFKRSLYDGAGF